MSIRLVGLVFAASTAAVDGFAEPLAAQLMVCREISQPEARLECYDGLAVRADLEVIGKGSAVTDPFTITEPRVLRFESEDAIMVVYLLNDAGDVVQNLHRGGAGVGEHLIEDPGQYRVQVNATGGWFLRLEAP
ncbi:MAG: hypothetical protein AAGK37_23410 [Pseudomonadota bacterium]